MVQNVSVVVSNVFDCLAIDIIMEKKKNITVDCLYGAPESDMNTCNTWIEENFTNISHKSMFQWRDFNIDLLNLNKHKPSEEFINIMYSNGLHSLINRPTRITVSSATLIENLFNNVVDNYIVSGLLLKISVIIYLSFQPMKSNIKILIMITSYNLGGL